MGLLPSLPPLLPPPPMLPPPTVWAMPVLAMVASGRGRLRLSPRLMLMPAFCTEVLVTLPLATLVLAMLVWAMALTDMALLLPPSPPLPPSLPPLLPPPSATAPLDTAATVCGNQSKAEHDNTTSQSKSARYDAFRRFEVLTLVKIFTYHH